MPENGHFGSLSVLFSKKENIPKTQTQFQVLLLFVHLSVYVSNSLLLACVACFSSISMFLPYSSFVFVLFYNLPHLCVIRFLGVKSTNMFRSSSRAEQAMRGLSRTKGGDTADRKSPRESKVFFLLVPDQNFREN